MFILKFNYVKKLMQIMYVRQNCTYIYRFMFPRVNINKPKKAQLKRFDFVNVPSESLFG